MCPRVRSLDQHYSTYINDIPPPIYPDTIRTQFADDIITLTRSYTSGQHKITQAKNKLKHELNNIEQWERRWRIQVNPNKCAIAAKPVHLETLDLINDIQINNTPVQTTTNIKILGFHFNFNKHYTTHISKITQTAKVNIAKLYRFKNAPTKIKQHLYTTLIRPILEYPAVEINTTGITNKHKLQRIQNKATRLITNTRLTDRLRSEDLHNNINLTPMNIRHDKLATKQLYKLNEKYHNPDPYINKGSDYEITEDPKQDKQKTLVQTIEEVIYADLTRCPWHNAIDISDWNPPAPIFT